MSERARRTLLALGLVVVTTAVYLPAGGFDFVSFDDPSYVTDNGAVLAGWSKNGVDWAFSTRYHGHWHPLTWLSHMTDVELFGLDAVRDTPVAAGNATATPVGPAMPRVGPGGDPPARTLRWRRRGRVRGLSPANIT